MPVVRCSKCALPYPESGLPYRCPGCGGIFDYDGPPDFSSASAAPAPGVRGLWRYRHLFGLPEQAPSITLGEGATPLIPVAWRGQMVWLKMESLNPTGSYKDRGSATLLSFLRSRGVREAVEDSSGNAGASFAAYAARAGIRARVFVPESASGPKRAQIEAYGADLIRIPGPRSAAAEAVLREVEQGAAYASHAYLPFGMPGIATIAYEIWEAMRGIGSVIAPVGHGGLFLGLLRGFMALQQAGKLAEMPYLVGVQAAACAPLAAAWRDGISALAQPVEGATLAEGVRVSKPVRAEAICTELQRGEIMAVEEPAILPAYQELARLGVYVEPTSALVWAALEQVFPRLPQPICLILSGSGLKYAV